MILDGPEPFMAACNMRPSEHGGGRTSGFGSVMLSVFRFA